MLDQDLMENQVGNLRQEPLLSILENRAIGELRAFIPMGMGMILYYGRSGQVQIEFLQYEMGM